MLNNWTSFNNTSGVLKNINCSNMIQSDCGDIGSAGWTSGFISALTDNNNGDSWQN